jgi:hypothetical protein
VYYSLSSAINNLKIIPNLTIPLRIHPKRGADISDRKLKSPGIQSRSHGAAWPQTERTELMRLRIPSSRGYSIRLCMGFSGFGVIQISPSILSGLSISYASGVVSQNSEVLAIFLPKTGKALNIFSILPDTLLFL